MMLKTSMTLILAGAVSLSAAQDEHAGHNFASDFAKVHFAVSCSPAAQQQFDRAVAYAAPFAERPMVKYSWLPTLAAVAFSAFGVGCGILPHRAAVRSTPAPPPPRARGWIPRAAPPPLSPLR